MFFRRADSLTVGGCDESLTITEDADLCLRLCRRGRIRLVITSDRRLAAWRGLRANLIYLYVTVRWGLELRAISSGTILISCERAGPAVGG
jgi:hypothetical protein